MILCIDIGNTNIKAALFDDIAGGGAPMPPLSVWRLGSDTRRTSDEYLAILHSLIDKRSSRYTPSAHSEAFASASAISSVVPPLTLAFTDVCTALTGSPPLLINANTISGLPVRPPLEARHEIGSDLFCDALEVYCRFRCPCIVVDAGTALSFVAVGGDGTIAGVAIAPGLNTAMRALAGGTAQLPVVPLKMPDTSLGNNTITAIQSGVVKGYTHLIHGLLDEMKSDLARREGCDAGSIRTAITGGLGGADAIANMFDVADKNITILGVARCYSYARGNI